MLWKLRAPTKDDESFIYSSWLQSFRSAPLVYGVPNTIYFKRFHDVLENLFKASSTRITIACSPDDPEQIFGYSVYSDLPLPVLHWVYVKHPFRGFGIARDLCSRVSPKLHTTKARESSLVKASAYDPFILLQYTKL